jgi:hypothetical protein
MPEWFDTVKVVKQERADLGGSSDDEDPFPLPINSQEDAIECAGILLHHPGVSDSTVYVTRNNDGKLIFKDPDFQADISLKQVYEGCGIGTVIRVQTTKLTVDASTTSTILVDLLSFQVTKTQADSKLSIKAFLSVNATTGNRIGGYAIKVGSVTLCGTESYIPVTTIYLPVALATEVTGLAAGSHTVALQWKIASGSLRCYPVSQPTRSYAFIEVTETTA